MLSRAFISLYVAVFVATMGISLVSPLLPVYARDLGASGVWIGLTFSAFAIVQAIVGPFVGQWSDRYGRKPFIIAGLLVYMVAALGYLTANSFPQVIAFRAFSGLGTSLIFSVARAYVGDMTPRGQEGRWAGVFATADIIGFGTGPLFAGVFREVLGFRSVFVAMAVLMALSAIIAFAFLPRTIHSSVDSVKRNPTATDQGLRAALHDRLVRALTIHMGLLSLASGATFGFLAIRLEDGLHVTPILIGIAFATQDISGGLTQPLFGRIADRSDRRLMVAVGLAWSAVMLIGLGFANSYWLALVLLCLSGAGGAFSQVAAGAMQVVAGRRVGMGSVLGLGSMGNGIGIVIGSVVGGLLIDFIALPAAFVFGGCAMFLGMLAFLQLTRGVRTNESDGEPGLGEAAIGAA